MKRLIIMCGFLLAMSVLLGGVMGCASTDQGRRESDIPWNQPQPWEGSPFIPGMDRY